MVVFHSYVSLSEGKTTIFLWFSYGFPYELGFISPQASPRPASTSSASSASVALGETGGYAMGDASDSWRWKWIQLDE